MYVVATAGHVDHGKSTLVRALTGMEPDRWAEERRRGLTIDLGFAWTALSNGEQVAFVDVPGHKRFVTNMLAGLGPAPAVMFVVAADEGWMPQSEEHLQAIAALGTSRLLLVITKADVAASDEALAQCRGRIASAGLACAGEVVVSSITEAGIDELRRLLDGLVRALPPPDANAPVRLWVDRAFSIRGAGTVVTGTLAAGRLRIDDELTLLPANRRVSIRGLQSLNTEREQVQATARVAVNLRGVDRDDVERGMTLVTPDAWTSASEIDVLTDPEELPATVVVHVGAAAVPAALRPLGSTAAAIGCCCATPPPGQCAPPTSPTFTPDHCGAAATQAGRAKPCRSPPAGTTRSRDGGSALPTSYAPPGSRQKRPRRSLSGPGGWNPVIGTT